MKIHPSCVGQSKPRDALGICSASVCVLFEMLTGKRAFVGENPPSVIAAILERAPAPLERQLG